MLLTCLFISAATADEPAARHSNSAAAPGGAAGRFLTSLGSQSSMSLALMLLIWLQVSLLLHLDDPLDAIAVHFWNGTWGVISSGFFAAQVLIQVWSLGFRVLLLYTLIYLDSLLSVCFDPGKSLTGTPASAPGHTGNPSLCNLDTHPHKPQLPWRYQCLQRVYGPTRPDGHGTRKDYGCFKSGGKRFPGGGAAHRRPVDSRCATRLLRAPLSP